MSMRWRVALPVSGLLVFALVSHHSFRMNREVQDTACRHFWWSCIELDTDPLELLPPVAPTCNGGECSVGWDVRSTWVHPGLLTKLLLLSGLPAFVVGLFVVRSLGQLGISEVLSFAILMPLLIFAWYYFVGWLVDRWTSRRSTRHNTARAQQLINRSSIPFPLLASQTLASFKSAHLGILTSIDGPDPFRRFLRSPCGRLHRPNGNSSEEIDCGCRA